MRKSHRHFWIRLRQQMRSSRACHGDNVTCANFGFFCTGHHLVGPDRYALCVSSLIAIALEPSGLVPSRNYEKHSSETWFEYPSSIVCANHELARRTRQL